MDITTILELALKIGRQIANQSNTKIDDELLDLLEVVYRDAWLREWLAGKSLQPVGSLAIEAAPSEQFRLALKRNNLSWTALLSKLPELLQLIQLIRAFAKK